MSVFYDVLMEKSAQRQEREEQQQGLSLVQKAGVGAAGLAGGLSAPLMASKSDMVQNYIANPKGREELLKQVEELGRQGGDENLARVRKLSKEFGDGVFSRSSRVSYGSGALGALGVGYGAKKLFDRYNARKRSEQR